MSKNDTATPATATQTPATAGDAPAVQTYTLLRQHTHAGKKYQPGHEFTAEEWGLTDKDIGWLQGVGTI